MERRSVRLAVIIGLSGAALCLQGCCDPSGESSPGEGARNVPSPRMPASWRVVRDFVASSAEMEAMSIQMKAGLAGVRNTVYDVKGGRVQINTIAAKGPQDAYKVVRYLQSVKPVDMILRNKNTVFEFVGRNDVLALIAEGRAHLLESQQAFPVKVAPGGPQQRIKRPPREASDGGLGAEDAAGDRG